MSRSYHHGALAEAMVEQALNAVREHGADHVSLRAIAQALDVSPSAAYNHFSDKDAVLVAVGRCGLAALDERMARVLAAHPGDSDEAARARFAGLGRAYVAFAVEEPNLFRLVFGPICAEADMGPVPTSSWSTPSTTSTRGAYLLPARATVSMSSCGAPRMASHRSSSRATCPARRAMR